MREMLGITALLYGQGMGEQVALLTDGRFSGRRAVCALDTLAQRQRWVTARPGAKRRQDSYRCCGGSAHIDVPAPELSRRQAQWQPPAHMQLGGTLEKYAALVGPANLGAVTHSGNVQWVG